MINRHLAKQSGYGTYLDCEICSSVVDGKQVVVGDLADYVEELEQACFEKEKKKSRYTNIRKSDKKRLQKYDEMIERVCTKLMISPSEFELQIYAMYRNLDLANLLLAQSEMKIKNLESTIDAMANVTDLGHKAINEMKSEVIKEKK